MHGVHPSARRLISAVVVMLAPLTGACAKKRVAEVTPPIATEPARSEAATSDEAARRDSLAREERLRTDRARLAADLEVLTTAVYFGFDESEITSEGRRRLDEKLAILQRHIDVSLLVEGHADERGSDEYNIALSQRRAASAKRYLTYRGIAESRIEIVGFGEERPVCEESQESCWSMNRRAEFVITRGALMSARP
jgi:peptidoglycan-associated lipoprotein